MTPVGKRAKVILIPSTFAVCVRGDGMEIHAPGIGAETERVSGQPGGSCQSRVVKGGKAFTVPCFTGQQCETVTQLSKNHYVDIGRLRYVHT